MGILPASLILNPILSIGFLRFSDILLLICYFSSFFLNRDLKIKLSSIILFILAILWFISSCMNYFLFSEFGLDISKNLRILSTLLWAPAIVNLAYGKKYDLDGVFVFTSSILALSSILIFFTVPNLHRIAGPFSYAGGDGLGTQASYNEWGALLCLAAALCLNRLMDRLSLYYSFCLLICLFGLVLTQSRSSLLAFVIMSVLLMFDRIVKNLRAKQFSFWSTTPIFYALPVAFLYSYVSEKIKLDRISDSFMTDTNSNDSILTRFVYWKDSYDLWAENFNTLFFGSGTLRFHALVGLTSDNYFLDLLSIFGLISLFLFIIYVCLLIYNSERGSVKFIFLTGMLSISLTGSTLADPIIGALYYIVLIGHSEGDGNNGKN
ncbi:O-antigen ligase family protein [Deinococcus fonticola]|uniref:O-antigen ligase family protein n=1 Tax=Deinococcus fonticola TaxID=2528713 RepID=UPI001074D6EA|nr:O-antigen ligase family protein [Deinococcus fonticola]